jgi:amino acid adenylation domain-containing protein
MPVGVPGELYLAGGGLSRGYLGRPELTAERFLPDPLAEEPGARMYRTGDLTFQRINGELEYLGRIDRQVKVRGYRIELGEVEAAIAAHSGVQAVAAMVREDQPGDRRLVAYVVVDDEAVTPAEIRRTVQARLPEAMTPSHLLFLAALPLSPNGKVDHRALPAPEAMADAGHELAAPRTHLEERLADLWRDVLKVERLGIHDSFWELGGHSLPAARLAHRVRESFGVELPVSALFELPTLAEYAAAIAEALQRPGGRAERMAPRVEDGPAPLSYAQQRLWFLDRLQPGRAVYNLPVLFGIAGPLAADALAAALAEIVRRHGVLRTTFTLDAESGEPVQVVAATSSWLLPRVDLAALPAVLRAAEAERLLAAERHRPFDLARGPLLRSLLVRLGPQDHRLALTMHHIVSDGWSVGVLRRELQALYGAAATGRPSPLPDLPLQYSDVSAWQRRWLAGGELAAQLAWWRQTLAGDPPALDLPTDRPRSAVQSLRGGQETLPLGPDLSAAVEQLGQRRGTTRFMTLLAAFKALLFRYTGQEDLWLGTPIANRTHLETEDLLGFFVNTLVLRTRLAGDPSFAELLGRVRETALAAYAHQDLPFEKLVEELAPARDLSRSPLFQVMFSFDGERMAPAELAPGVTLEPLDVTLEAAKFDLTLAVESGPEGLTASLEYAADLFDAATARRLLACFHRLLERAADDPEARIAELSLLTPMEREEVLAAGEGTTAPIPGEPVHRLFEARVREAPEALAVTWEGGHLTYGELDRRANRLAHRLRELGTGPESVAAILLERSPELVIAVLATAKAGGAWLPIDPSYPSERIATMLRDAKVGALLTTATQLAHMPSLPILLRRVLWMDEPDDSGGSMAPAAGALDPDHLAYVIYTSGSTGTPKGTALTHRGLANLVAWHRRTYALSPADRSPLLAGLGFDASVWEMWPALATGASLHLPPADTIPSPAALLAWLATERITIAFLPTPLAEAVLEEMRTAPPPELALRAILTGGDRLLRRPSPDLPFALVNHYGPTESTVVATAGIVTPTGVRAPDIGSAIANTRIHLLDRALRPVPVGIPGELCIAGAGLARGYRGRPGLTAERFMPDPLGEGPGERLYRTGDLARRLPGGLVEFLGRVDHQVKIRGIRIELGEIESALNAQPDVAAAVVLAREEGSGDRRLVAYVVAPAGPEPAELRERLARRLPAAMVPSAWVFLDALPLTPNGKVDRRALPAPEPAPAGWELVPPRTPIEEQVADIWRAVLAVDRVGVYDNFWDLGGHSLLATKVLARIRDAFGIDLPLKTLFTAPSLGELTAALGQSLLAAHGEEAADLLAELDGLSEDEIRSLLAAEARAVEELT